MIGTKLTRTEPQLSCTESLLGKIGLSVQCWNLIYFYFKFYSWQCKRRILAFITRNIKSLLFPKREKTLTIHCTEMILLTENDWNMCIVAVILFTCILLMVLSTFLLNRKLEYLLNNDWGKDLNILKNKTQSFVYIFRNCSVWPLLVRHKTFMKSFY